MPGSRSLRVESGTARQGAGSVRYLPGGAVVTAGLPGLLSASLAPPTEPALQPTASAARSATPGT